MIFAGTIESPNRWMKQGARLVEWPQSQSGRDSWRIPSVVLANFRRLFVRVIRLSRLQHVPALPFWHVRGRRFSLIYE